jgi:NADH:flavin oxidoreductase / NADH oxidase family
MTQPDAAPLFSPYALGELQLRNRVVMASMTRGRARDLQQLGVRILCVDPNGMLEPQVTRVRVTV